MKIIKLDRRWRQYKEYGHAVAVKFRGWQPEVIQLESVLRSLTGTGGVFREGAWYGYYGKRPYNKTISPYYITVKDEATLTMALLKVQSQNE